MIQDNDRFTQILQALNPRDVIYYEECLYAILQERLPLNLFCKIVTMLLETANGKLVREICLAFFDAYQVF